MKKYEKYDFLKELHERYIPDCYITTKNKIEYINIPCAFDIETSSFYNEYGEKSAIMYIWQFGIYNDLIVYGRTYTEFIELLETLQNFFQLSEKRRLLCFVHNLGYEFYFLHLWLCWLKVFSIEKYTPVYALCLQGIEFRCSYLESGYSLKTLGDKLVKYPVKKLTGNLDYDLIRHSKTEITQKELDYCENDIQILLNYVRERFDNGDDITDFKITKTSYVRAFIRDACFHGVDKKGNWNRTQYKKLTNQLKLETPYFYGLCKNIFMGGFAHANCFNSGKVLKNVVSFDKTSDYPSIMVSEQFPVSQFQQIEILSYADFQQYLELYCCMFIVILEDVETNPDFDFDNYISKSKKLYFVEGETLNNGRIMSAKKIIIGVTEIDYKIINMNYDYKNKGKSVTLVDFWVARKGYLPRNFILAILELYRRKTEYKGLEDKKEEYKNAKEMLNSGYGMLVTDPVQEEIIYSSEISDYWKKSEDKTIQEYINDYDNNKNRFTYYPWGIYVTAYARLYIWNAIANVKTNYIYSDTDSLKFIKTKKLMEYFEKDNELTIYKLKKSAEENNIPFELFKPKNKKGEEKIIGLWDFEGEYNLFKTMGSKRYMYVKKLNPNCKNDNELLQLIEQNPKEYALQNDVELLPHEINEYNENELKNYLVKWNELNITISGLNKYSGKKYLIQNFKTYEEIFNYFNENMIVSPDFSGRKTHTYIAAQRHGKITDYNGVECEYFEQSAIHMENSAFTMHMGQYLDLIRYVTTGIKPD